MSTKSIHDRWASRFAELQAWLEKHGRMPRNTQDAGEQERRISSWVTDQRARHKSGIMPAAYAKELRTVDGLLGPRPLSQRQEDFKAWVGKHGRRPLPGSRDPEEADFAVLFFSLRSYALRGRLKPATVDLILSVPGGFTTAEAETVRSLLAAKLDAKRLKAAAAVAGITPLEAKWNRGFAELEDWFRQHGTLPNRRSTDAAEYRAANWLNVQRMQARKDNLLPEYVAKLRAFPGALQTRPQTADRAVADRVTAFHAEHHRLPAWHGATSAERSLNACLRRLRQKNDDGTLSGDVLATLTLIPGATDPVAGGRTPHQRLADLEDLIKTTGRFPTRGPNGTWAYRALKGKASRNPMVAAEIQLAVERLRASVRRGKVPAQLA